MKLAWSTQQFRLVGQCAGLIVAWLVCEPLAFAETKGDKAFTAVVTDVQGVETEMKNILFYWEEKLARPPLSPMN